MAKSLTIQNKQGEDLYPVTASSLVYNRFSGEPVEQTLNNKQDTLVSGTNIKTINNNSILGSGNIDIPKGDKGDPLTYSDLTEEQKAEIAQPAAEQAAIAAGHLATIQAALDGLDPSQSTEAAITTLTAQLADTQADVDELGPKIDQLVDRKETIQTDDYNSISYIISPSDVKWYNENATQASKVIPIPEGIVSMELIPTSGIMMWSFLSSYTAPTANKQAVRTIASGMNARYSASERTVITEFSNAKYLVVRADTASNMAMCPTITVHYGRGRVDDLEESVSSMIEDVEETKEATMIEKPISLNDIAAQNCYLYANNGVAYWQNNENKNNGKFYPVEAGKEYLIVGNSTNTGSRIAFVKNNTHTSGAVSNFASGWTNFISLTLSVEIRLIAPQDAAYLFCNTHNSNGSCEPSKIARIENVSSDVNALNVDVDVMNLVSDYVVTNPQRIDIGALYEHEAALGGNKKWTFNNNYLYGKHKALPVTEGETYIVKCSNRNNFYGYVTNSYSPEYANLATIPYVAGYDRVLASGSPVILTVPAGASYLILGTVNGSGNISSWTVFKADSVQKRVTNKPFVKFRFATWNIGIFKYYRYKTDHVVQDISDADAESAALEYRKMIDSIGANIFGICEYRPNYPKVNSSSVTADKIFGCFAKRQIGTYFSDAACNAIFFNSPMLVSTSEKIFERTVKNEIDSSAAQRYYKEVTMLIGGNEVHVVETHLDHSNAEIRAAQIQELVTAMSNYEYVIIGGDFNTASASSIDSEISILKSGGYTVANNGYIGLYVTSEDGWKIDNIATKGFAMTNINVVEAAGNLSDHWIVYCDLEML